MLSTIHINSKKGFLAAVPTTCSRIPAGKPLKRGLPQVRRKGHPNNWDCRFNAQRNHRQWLNPSRVRVRILHSMTNTWCLPYLAVCKFAGVLWALLSLILETVILINYFLWLKVKMQYKQTNYKKDLSPQPLREMYTFKLLNFQLLIGNAPREALGLTPSICESPTTKFKLA